MTAETDLLPLPWIERYAVVGDIAYPVSSDPDGDYVAHDDHAAAMQAYARACVSSALEAAREDGWLTMESCPVNQRVMLWNQDECEMFLGHKPEDAPSEDAVITNCTAAYADAWRTMPSEPESETYDGPPQLSVVPAIDQARGKAGQEVQ